MISETARDEAAGADDRYLRRGPIGSGGEGVVERVWDRLLLLEVARKRLRIERDAPEVLYRLKSEFRALRDISHPNLAQLFDLEVAGLEGFFTMELIDGGDFVSYVREGAGSQGSEQAYCSWAALRERFTSAAAQLVRGLTALHLARKIHRDVKPPNVLVEATGRVVLLDFGFVSHFRARDSEVEDVAGTFEYQAPEIFLGARASPASDWYSVGVMLFGALTGLLPYRGSLHQTAPRTDAVRWPEDTAREVPPRILDVITGLLHPTPSARASGDDLVDALGSPTVRLGTRPPRQDAPETVFVGRGDTLAHLEGVLHGMQQSRLPQVIQIRAQSGMGKSELVERFLSQVPRPSTLLQSRCHLHEAIPFQALDQIVDEVSRTLLDQPRDGLPSFEPASVAALTQLFPVLLRVPWLASAPEDGLAVEAHERRRQGASALAILLAWLAERGPLVVWIDDAQWGDRDSAQLLREVLRARPAPPMLLVLTIRSEQGLASSFPEEIVVDTHCAVERIELEALRPDETRALASALLGGVGAVEEQARVLESIVAESAGVPFLASEIAKLARSNRDFWSPAGELRLPHVGDVVRDRLQLVAGLSRELLEIVAVAGRPMGVDLTCDLLATRGAARPLLPGLVNHSLVRRSRRGAGDTIEVYHDRIREALLSEMPDLTKQRWHRHLAEHFARTSPAEAQILVTHWLGAGETALAATHAVPAANDAMTALAFDRAAELFGLAHRLRGSLDQDWQLLEQQGRALSAAGRGLDAGETFEAAAAARRRAAPNPAAEVTLRRSAGEQFLSGGGLHRGVQVLREVLADLDVVMPTEAPAARRAALMARIPALLGRRRVVDSALVPPRAVQRLDALWAAAKGTLMLDFVLSDAMSARHLLEAKRSGHPSHLALALCMEAGFEANIGGRWLTRRSRRIHAEAAALALSTGLPYDEGWIHGSQAAVSYYAECWAETIDAAERAVAIFSRRCIGAAWESTAVQTFLLASLVHLGRIRDLQARSAALLEDARSRGDLLGQATVRTGHVILAPLAADEPERALADAEAMLLPFSTDHYTSQHFHHVVATIQIHLYAGDGWRAWERIQESWPHLRKAGFLLLDCLGGQLRYLRALSGLAACASEPPPLAGAASTQAQIERAVVEDARYLERSSVPSAAARAAVLRAELAALHHDGSTAQEKLHAARAGFARSGMLLHRAAADVALASHRRDEGARAAALDEMRNAGAKNPVALASTLFPRRALGTQSPPGSPRDGRA